MLCKVYANVMQKVVLLRCRLGILAPFRLRQVQEIRLRSKTCAKSTIRVGTLTLRQEREMGAGCGTPIRGPWAGLETCELPPDGGASAVAALWPRSGAAQACASCAVRPGAGAGRAHHGPSGACAGRGRPRPGAGRARAGAAGMATRDQVGLLARRYPAATAGGYPTASFQPLGIFHSIMSRCETPCTHPQVK